MNSDNVKKGPERAPNRSLFYALGYTPEELAGLALSLALRSYADQLACQRILDLIAPQEATKAERKRRVKEG